MIPMPYVAVTSAKSTDGATAATNADGTATVSQVNPKAMSKADFKALKKALKKAGFKGKVKQA